jgi:hypothetical protein
VPVVSTVQHLRGRQIQSLAGLVEKSSVRLALAELACR